MPCLKYAWGIICIGAAATGNLNAQASGYSPGRSLAPSDDGVAFRYGVTLPGHITLYRSGGSSSLRAFGSRSVADDAVVYVSAELRMTAGELTLFDRNLRFAFVSDRRGPCILQRSLTWRVDR